MLSRIILASTNRGDWILDPFCGSSTTGIAASLLGRRYLGIDKEIEFVEMSKRRRMEIENYQCADFMRSKLRDLAYLNEHSVQTVCEEDIFGVDLPF